MPQFPTPNPSSSSVPPGLRRRLERCWHKECDIDPLILRLRRLRRRRGARAQAAARSVEQEMLPIL
ncbi:hypothetical protein [Synechococcus sp. MIT S9452]|uniref:hypothetical protein n=1 Tax=Synechococcus sp. MIT S9452 TaxID=3082546 RepID=UPI000136D89C